MTKIERLYEEACQRVIDYERVYVKRGIYDAIFKDQQLWYWRGRRDSLYLLLKVKEFD